MREIKFRVWDGFNVHYDWLVNFKDKGINYILSDIQEVAGDLMQYTGLKDKNGKEIYSGDILFNEVKNGVVQWSDKYMGLMSSEIHKMDGEGVYEVIGNIYENPDLLLSSEGDII
jgi:hypothetical protein